MVVSRGRYAEGHAEIRALEGTMGGEADAGVGVHVRNSGIAAVKAGGEHDGPRHPVERQRSRYLHRLRAGHSNPFRLEDNLRELCRVEHLRSLHDVEAHRRRRVHFE